MIISLDIELGGLAMDVADVVKAMQSGLRVEVTTREYKRLDLSANSPRTAREAVTKGVRAKVFVKVMKPYSAPDEYDRGVRDGLSRASQSPGNGDMGG